MVVGRGCSMKLTRYTWSTALAEQIEASRVAEELAAERYGTTQGGRLLQRRFSASCPTFVAVKPVLGKLRHVSDFER